MRISVGLILLTLSFSVVAQRVQISGQLLDDTGSGLVGATVTLQNQSDSIMVAFAITGDNGKFELPKAPKGTYYLMASFMGFESYTTPLNITESENETLVLDPIRMSPDQKVLSEVVVDSRRIPITLKQDTIEYDALAFETAPNASVEDLLKKLPGVDVERDGTVKAQGENVQKVLVDGKEFFGNDPKIATKNLPADAVDKVQVFDKKSDFAEFAGIEDGNEQKTINLSLKEDKKNGTFGKITGAYGTDSRFLGKANINRFNSESQLSFIGNGNNINEVGFTLSDYLNFSGNGGLGSGGSFSIEIPNGISIGGQGDDGIISSATTGLNFNRDFGKKLELRSNYMFNGTMADISRNSNRTNFLEDGETFGSESESMQDNRTFAHNFSSKLKYKIDPSQDITISTKGGFLSRNFSVKSSNIAFKNNQNLNTSSNDNHTTGQDYSIDIIAGYRKKFLKPGRTISAELNSRIGNAKNESNISALSTVFLGDSTMLSTILQNQLSDDQILNYSGNFGFTEPLGKHDYIALQYEHKNHQNNVSNDYFDIVNEELIRNGELSIAFNRDYYYDRVGGSYHFNQKKFKFSAGMDYQTSKLKGDLVTENTLISKNFNRMLPNASFEYEFGTSKNLKLFYRTNLNEPSLQQLQPVVNNADPMRIYQGNPDLNAEYQHELNMNLLWFDQFSFTNFFAFISAIYTENKIVTASNIDDQLTQKSQPINTDYDWLLTSSWSYGMPIKPLKIKIGLRHRATYNQGFIYLNNVENIAKRCNHSATFKIENRNKGAIDVVAGTKVQYNTTLYSENSLFDQSYLNYDHFVDFKWKINDKWLVKTTVDHYTYSSEDFSTQPDRTLCKAEISRFILKENRGQIKLSAFDLFNQNVIVNRNSTANYLEEERVASLGRYFMLGFTYSLSAFKESGIQIEKMR